MVFAGNREKCDLKLFYKQHKQQAQLSEKPQEKDDKYDK
jgi:hypothetical protein